MKTLQRASNLVIAFSIIMLASCGSKPNYNVSLKTDVDSASYYLGVLYGGQMKSAPDAKNLNIDAIARGLSEGLSIADSVWQKEGMAAQSYLQKYFTAVQAKVNAKNLEEAHKFMEENKSKEGVQTMPSGLQYIVITEGTGVKPNENDTVKVFYEGSLPDGTVFDSNKDRPEAADFVPARMIPGFREALTLMPEGSVWKVFIPAELGYGEQVRPGGKIPANSALVFEINATKVIPAGST